ncbi:MAG: ParA family protein [Planctomycetaceae bacterium]|jgi:chromosome partitioning protein|nr:ParA family protein [Planctomycetaceae bacterium]
MQRVFSIANQKGGVGKTTTAITLADGFARAGARTLLVDLDPQCNATSGLGIEKTAEHPLVSGIPIPQAVVQTATTDLWILPGTRSAADAEVLAGNSESESRRMEEQLIRQIQGYDFVLIDCPPSLGRLTQIALTASTEVLIPMQCEYYAMEGLTQMIQVIKDVMQRQPERLEFGGVVLTMYDYALELTHEVDKEVRDFFGEIVFNTVIPRDVTITEASSHGKSIIDYAPRSHGARAYVELCLELLEKI